MKYLRRTDCVSGEVAVMTLIILWYTVDVWSGSVRWPWWFMSDGVLGLHIVPVMFSGN